MLYWYIPSKKYTFYHVYVAALVSHSSLITNHLLFHFCFISPRLRVITFSPKFSSKVKFSPHIFAVWQIPPKILFHEKKKPSWCQESYIRFKKSNLSLMNTITVWFQFLFFKKKKSIEAQILVMRVLLYRLINKNSNNIYNNFDVWRMAASLRVNRTFSSNVIDFWH